MPQFFLFFNGVVQSYHLTGGLSPCELGIDYGGGGSGLARAPRYGGFDLDDYEW